MGRMVLHLQHHIDNVHNKSIKCPKCPRKVGDFSLLIGHYRTIHLGYKQYKCKECGSLFGMRTNLRHHILNVHKKITDTKGKMKDLIEKHADIDEYIEDFKATQPDNYPSTDFVKQVIRQQMDEK